MILALNTATIQYSIALLHASGSLMAEVFLAPGSTRYASFLPNLHHVLQTSQTDIGQLEAIVVTTGPGSFTGLRVGLATAKGLAQGLQRPIIGISSLEAMAAQLATSTHPICPILNSRRGEVFCAVFGHDREGVLEQIEAITCLPFEDLPHYVKEPTVFVGHDFEEQAPRIKAILGSRAFLAPAHLWALKASAVGARGLERHRAQDCDDLDSLVPTYLRPPDIRSNPFPLATNPVDNRIPQT
jgi:tRNA threonylcarbamoyladenosine biosynthesis protein TsaB